MRVMKWRLFVMFILISLKSALLEDSCPLCNELEGRSAQYRD